MLGPLSFLKAVFYSAFCAGLTLVAYCVLILVFGGILALSESNAWTGALLTILGFVVDVLALASSAGLLFLAATAFIAPGMGAGFGARQSLDDAADGATDVRIQSIAAALAGLTAFYFAASTSWSWGRAAGVLPEWLSWPGPFHASPLVVGATVINALVASVTAWRGK